MGIFKAKKTTKYKRSKLHGRPTSIKSLPRELLMEVLARVASASFNDLFNAKLSCKDFLEISEDDYIFQHVSLDKFSVNPLNTSTEASFFLERCRECGNPESLYRQGMVFYFSYRMTELGFEYLKKATEKGHVEATYVYSIILLCSGDQSQLVQGIKILSSLKNKSGRWRMKECRERMWTILWRSMWWFNKSSFVRQQIMCSRKEPCKLQKINRWLSVDELVDEYDDILCEACRCNREVTWFYYMQHGRDYYSFLD